MNLVGEGTVSDLSHQYFAQVTGFVRGSVSFDQLYDWVCAFAADLADSTDPMVRRLDDRFWELIGEQGRGDRSVETVREELGSISAQVVPIAAIPFEALSVPRIVTFVSVTQSEGPLFTVSSSSTPQLAASTAQGKSFIASGISKDVEHDLQSTIQTSTVQALAR